MNLHLFLLLISLEMLLLEHGVWCFSDSYNNCSTQVKKYSVAHSGKNSTECLNMLLPCATLEYVLESNTSLDCVTIVLQDAQTLSRKQSLYMVNSFAIIGNGSGSGSSVNISCKENSGIYFEFSQQVHLENLNFIGCATAYNFIGTDDYLHLDTVIAGVYFYYGSNISITESSFINGCGTGLILKDVIGEVQVTNTNFIGNKPSSFINESTSGGLIIYRRNASDTVNYTINGCFFSENIQYNHNPSFGGGLTFIHNVQYSISYLTILSTNFSKNQAMSGGGLHVAHATTFGSYGSYVKVTINNSLFNLNNASVVGGGAWITGSSSPTVVYIAAETCFESNRANDGGGMAVYTDSSNNNSITVAAYDSTWKQNKAKMSGSGVHLHVDHVSQGLSGTYNYSAVTGTFQNCNFNDNMVDTNLIAVGAIYVDGARINFIGGFIKENEGTALYIRHSGYATFSGNVTFTLNFGLHGSAIYVSYDSVIALHGGVNLMFSFNVANFDRGGAIYTEGNDGGIKHTPCVFESLNELLNSTDKFKVTFFYNNAHGKIQSIYVSDPTNCLEKTNVNALMDKRIFSYTPNVTSQIASRGFKIDIAVTGAANSTNENGTLELMLGESFYINPTVHDKFGNPSILRGNLVLRCVNRVNTYPCIDGPILIGPTYISMDEYTKNSWMYIKGGSEKTPQDLSVTFIYDEDGDSFLDTSVEFQIKLIECKPGYLYNVNSKICECSDKNDTNNLVCHSNSIACVRSQYWYGSQGNYSDVLPCPGITCGKCDMTKCADSPGFCRLDNIQDQCLPGRNGTLCSHCQDNYSFTFSALSCVETSGCNSKNTALIVFGIVLYWVIFILLVFLILSLNLSVGSGFMYGIVYYFGVIYLYTDNTITDNFLTRLVHTCVAFTQLCPRAIGYARICFAASWNQNLHHQTFHYFTPAFVATSIFAVIWLSRFCRCPRRISLAQNSPIHAITILVLFSYSSLAYTSFEILKPLNIYNETVVYVDPDWKYFHKEHLPYALLAIFVECFIALPVCFLLLFAPCLSKRLNLVKLKLKPIVDEFQACYRPECRWFAGFYFLARQLVYLANAIPQLSGPQSLPQDNVVLHYLNAVILIVHASFQPYKLKWLNFLDILLLSDILLISFNIDSTFELGFIQKVMAYVLILFPSLYLLCILMVLIARRIQLFVKPFCSFTHKMVRNRMQVNADVFPSHDIPTQSSVVLDSSDGASADVMGPRNASLVDSFYKDNGEREPLLSDSRSSTNSSSNGTKTNDTFTTSSVRLSSVAKFPFSLAHRNTNKASTN